MINMDKLNKLRFIDKIDNDQIIDKICDRIKRNQNYRKFYTELLAYHGVYDDHSFKKQFRSARKFPEYKYIHRFVKFMVDLQLLKVTKESIAKCYSVNYYQLINPEIHEKILDKLYTDKKSFIENQEEDKYDGNTN